MHLRTLFPRHPRPRTVVHAGPLLSKVDGGVRALRRYLRVPRERELFLIHHGETPLSEIAADVGVTDITLEPATADAEAEGAAELAVALGARRLDFTIDEPAIPGPTGAPMREVTLREAESLAEEPGLRPRVRAKLRAGCEAMRHGLTRVRIGSPQSLIRNRATVLVRDPIVPLRVPDEETAARSPAPQASVAAAAKLSDGSDAWPRPRGTGAAPGNAGRPRSLVA